FNYLPKTYTQETIEEFKRYFKNYKISKNNLWLIKPRNSSLGNKIRFLKSVNDVRKNEIVTKYISNPLLINGKKFDLRFHVLVTGHNPLKIYVHSNGWAKVSSEKYDIDLDQLDNIFKHVTNLYLNKKNKNNFKVKESVVSFEKIKKYLKKEYKLNFSEIEKKVNDIIIKSIITMNHLEIKKENSMKLKSNNIYDLYGVDIMIDENFKPWLIEININPTLAEESLTLDRKKMLRQTLVDLFNIIGIVPYSHIDGKALEGEKKFKNYIEEAIQQSICEFTRPLGGFKRIFPLKSNIEIYKKYFKEISPINKYLWDTINNNLY
ncbi:TTL-domain-containing protein, partial [Piromyces finnis]